MSEKQQAVYPVFVFRMDPESDDGLLFYNSFGRWPRRRQKREIADIIDHLRRPGRIPPDGVVIGWPGSGLKPVNAVDTADAELMAPWFARAFKVDVGRGAERMTDADDEPILADEKAHAHERR